MVSKNTKKSASISVHGFQSYFKDDKRFNLDVISKQEAPQLLKHFLVEIILGDPGAVSGGREKSINRRQKVKKAFLTFLCQKFFSPVFRLYPAPTNKFNAGQTFPLPFRFSFIPGRSDHWAPFLERPGNLTGPNSKSREK